MKKYLVTKDCAGYKGRYWRQDMIVELDDSEKPPKHFELISAEKEKDIRFKSALEKDKPVTLSELGMRRPEEVVTAAKVLGNRK